MKYTKKLLSLVLVLVLALALAVPGFAAEITIANGKPGETYTAYKIFDVTSSGDNYAYTISKDSNWKSVVENYKVNAEDKYDASGSAVFQLVASATDSSKLVVKINKSSDKSLFETEAQAAEFAKYLSSSIPRYLVNGTDFYQDVADAEGKVSFGEGNLPAGYYFVDTTTGALCSLYTSSSSQEIKDKNSLPTLEKKIVVNDSTTDTTTASIGDVVNFKITVTDGIGTDTNIVIHDTMENGLTLDKNSIKIDDVAASGKVSYPAEVEGEDDNCTFEITLNGADYADRAQIVITYSATLNKSAEISHQTNDNTAWLTYSAHTSTKDTVTVSSFRFDLVKTTGDGTVLDGASFKLYTEKTSGEEIKVVKTDDGIYRVAEDAEADSGEVIQAGQATISGLGNGTYYLEETAAPDGYNLLTERVKVEIKDSNIVAAAGEDGKFVASDGDTGIIVVNETGIVLPGTGGMGTTIFYTLGGVLVVGAAILLVTKKRVHDVEG